MADMLKFIMKQMKMIKLMSKYIFFYKKYSQVKENELSAYAIIKFQHFFFYNTRTRVILHSPHRWRYLSSQK